MDKNELLKVIDKEVSELLELKKSFDEKAGYEEKTKKPEASSEAKEGPSDAEGDAMHAADEGSEDLGAYAKKLSDDELYELLSALSAEAEGRGVGEDSPTEGQSVAPTEAGAMPPEAGMDPMAAEAGAMPPEAGMDPMADAGMDPNASAKSLESHVSELSDEEIGNLAALLEQEKSKRTVSAAQGSAPGAPLAQSAPQMGGMPPEAMMMKSDMAALQKSISDLAKSVESIKTQSAKDRDTVVAQLKGKIATLEKSLSPAATENTLPASTYADPQVKVLQKSEGSAPEVKLMGEQLAAYLYDEQKKGNKSIKSSLVSKANLCKSEEQVDELYVELKRLGVKLPS